MAGPLAPLHAASFSWHDVWWILAYVAVGLAALWLLRRWQRRRRPRER